MRQFENQEHWDSVANHYQQTAHPFTALFAEAALARVTLTPRSRWQPRAPAHEYWRPTSRPAWWDASPLLVCPMWRRG